MFQCSINTGIERLEPRLEPLPALQPEGRQFSGVDMVGTGTVCHDDMFFVSELLLSWAPLFWCLVFAALLRPPQCPHTS
jgi:hypothetical protein